MTDVPLTLLFIDPIGVPAYSARGLTQLLEPIQQINQNSGTLRRTVNGKLVNTMPSQFNLYHSVITGSDVAPPVKDGVWPGTQVVVDCIETLTFNNATGAQEREAVDSDYSVDGDFTTYRPRLRMTIVSMTMTADEWQAGVTWTLELEETGG